jgi:CBS domain-containing protein
MSENLITVDAQNKIKNAIELMVKKDVGSIVVTEKGKPVGIVTERDISKRTCISENLCDKRIEDIMSTPIITVDSETAIGEAGELMDEKNIRRLLVTKDGRIVGIVTQKDLMRSTLDVFQRLLHAVR